MITNHEFQSNGTIIRGTLSSTDSEYRENPLIVVLTGDSPNGSKSKTWAPVTTTLTNVGFDVFVFDFHSQGNSDGIRENLCISEGTQNFKDALAYLTKNLGYSIERIGVFGSSFGGSVVLNAIELTAGMPAVAFKSPASFLPEAYETEHQPYAVMDAWKQSGISPVTGLGYNAYIDAIDTNLYAKAKVINQNVLVIHGDSDDIVPIQQSRRLKHVIGDAATLIELPGVNHDYKQEGAMDRLLTAVSSFFIDQIAQ